MARREVSHTTAPSPRAPRKKPTGRARARAPAKVAEPRTRLDVDERRAQLLELGLQHFASTSYDDVSIDDIAAAAGISKGLLYHYFPTKRAFYAASVREAANRLLAACDTGTESVPLERLHAGLDAYLSFVLAHGAAYATLMRSGVGVDRELALIVDETRLAFVAKLTEGLTPILAATPLVRIALRGWVGLAEAMSLGWLEAVRADSASAPSQEKIRDLLATALIETVQSLQA